MGFRPIDPDPYFKVTDDDTQEEHIFIVSRQPDHPPGVYHLRMVGCQHCDKYVLKGVFKYDEKGVMHPKPPIQIYKKD